MIPAPLPQDGDALVIHNRGPYGAVWIFVPVLDASTLDVARDALLARDKKRASAVLKDLGPYAGIGAALLEVQARSLDRASSGKTSRQLDRDIEDFLKTRKS